MWSKRRKSGGVFRQKLSVLLLAPRDEEISNFRKMDPGKQKNKSGFSLILREFLRLFLGKDLHARSAALSFQFILSIIPLLAIVYTIFKALGGFRLFLDKTLKPLIMQNFNTETATQIGQWLDSFVDKYQTTDLPLISIVTLIYTVMSLFNTAETAFDHIFESTSRRKIPSKFLNYWILITLTPLLVVFSTAKSDQLWQWISQATQSLHGDSLLSFLGAVVGLATQSLAFAVLYFFLPNRKLQLKSILLGALAAGFMFEMLQHINVWLSRLMISDVNRMQMYGSIPLIAVIFFLWLRYVWLVVLMGGALAAACDKVIFNPREVRILHAPIEDLERCAAVFHAICQEFQISSHGIAPMHIEESLALPAPEVHRWIVYIETHGLVLSRVDAQGTALLPTWKGLEMHREPRVFFREILCANAKGIEGENWNRTATLLEGDFLDAIRHDIKKAST